MNSDKLLKRQRFIKATPLKDRASLRTKTRRSNNFVEAEKEKGEEFESFFDFEEDLSDIKPSNIQAEESDVLDRSPKPISMELESSVSVDTYSGGNLELPIDITNEDSDLPPGYFQMEPDDAQVASSNSVCMEPEEIPKPNNISETKPKYMDVKGFKFKQCLHMKRDGEQCKRQAPKSNELCSIHRRIKNNKK